MLEDELADKAPDREVLGEEDLCAEGNVPPELVPLGASKCEGGCQTLLKRGPDYKDM